MGSQACASPPMSPSLGDVEEDARFAHRARGSRSARPRVCPLLWMPGCGPHWPPHPSVRRPPYCTPWRGPEGALEAVPEPVRQAVGGGCQSGWGRLLTVTNAIEAGTCRQGDSGWA